MSKQLSSVVYLILTARYCGVRVPRPARFPQMEVLLSCWICCTSCCCRRRCSLSLCVSANFTTKGEEQPWSSEQVKDVRLAHEHTEESTTYLLKQEHSHCKEIFSRGVLSMPQDSYYACCIHIKANTQRTFAMQSWTRPHSKRGTGQFCRHWIFLALRDESTDKQITDGDNT